MEIISCIIWAVTLLVQRSLIFIVRWQMKCRFFCLWLNQFSTISFFHQHLIPFMHSHLTLHVYIGFPNLFIKICFVNIRIKIEFLLLVTWFRWFLLLVVFSLDDFLFFFLSLILLDIVFQMWLLKWFLEFEKQCCANLILVSCFIIFV